MQCVALRQNENDSTSLLSGGDRLQQCYFVQHRHELPAINTGTVLGQTILKTSSNARLIQTHDKTQLAESDESDEIQNISTVIVTKIINHTSTDKNLQIQIK